MAIALESWPTFPLSGSGYGIAGQWNDIATSESLYFIIEHSTLLSTPEVAQNNISAFIDTKTQQLVLSTDGALLDEISLYAVTGQQVKTIQTNNQNRFDVSSLQSGVYLAEIRMHSGKTIIRKVAK
ncbi:MAG: T9SS type A sorting domain-containing protein [Flavobacteriaceae bacterium]